MLPWFISAMIFFPSFTPHIFSLRARCECWHYAEASGRARYMFSFSFCFRFSSILWKSILNYIRLKHTTIHRHTQLNWLWEMTSARRLCLYNFTLISDVNVAFCNENYLLTPYMGINRSCWAPFISSAMNINYYHNGNYIWSEWHWTHWLYRLIDRLIGSLFPRCNLSFRSTLRLLKKVLSTSCTLKYNFLISHQPFLGNQRQSVMKYFIPEDLRLLCAIHRRLNLELLTNYNELFNVMNHIQQIIQKFIYSQVLF